MEKKKILLWIIAGIFVFGLGFGVMALIDHHKSSPEQKISSILIPDKEAERQAATQTVVTAEAMSYHSKAASANLEAVVKELDNIRPIQPGQTHPVK